MASFNLHTNCIKNLVGKSSDRLLETAVRQGKVREETVPIVMDMLQKARSQAAFQLAFNSDVK